jgi:hypothetical protein
LTSNNAYLPGIGLRPAGHVAPQDVGEHGDEHPDDRDPEKEDQHRP